MWRGPTNVVNRRGGARARNREKMMTRGGGKSSADDDARQQTVEGWILNVRRPVPPKILLSRKVAGVVGRRMRIIRLGGCGAQSTGTQPADRAPARCRSWFLVLRGRPCLAPAGN